LSLSHQRLAVPPLVMQDRRKPCAPNACANIVTVFYSLNDRVGPRSNSSSAVPGLILTSQAPLLEPGMRTQKIANVSKFHPVGNCAG
jgi:hypothetical protein